jgi:hypothetical protein
LKNAPQVSTRQSGFALKSFGLPGNNGGALPKIPLVPVVFRIKNIGIHYTYLIHGLNINDNSAGGCAVEPDECLSFRAQAPVCAATEEGKTEQEVLRLFIFFRHRGQILAA